MDQVRCALTVVRALLDTADPSGGEVYRTDDYAAFFLRPETDRIASPRDVGDSPFCIELLVSPVARDVESRSHGVMLRGGF